MSEEPQSSLILYQTEDGQTKVEVRLVNETVWLSVGQMAELFQRDKSTISKHIDNIFAEGELTPEATVARFATVQTEGGREVTRDIEFYNLDVVISVGYRVKSHRGTQFRIWATKRLREFIVKGFTLDDERLKQGGAKNTYFDVRHLPATSQAKSSGHRSCRRREGLPRSSRVRRGLLDLRNEFDLDGSAQRQRSDAHGGTGVLPAIPKDGHQQIGTAVEHLRLMGELRRGIDEAAHPHDAFHF
jgi:Virulence protein RhuM family